MRRSFWDPEMAQNAHVKSFSGPSALSSKPVARMVDTVPPRLQELQAQWEVPVGSATISRVGPSVLVMGWG